MECSTARMLLDVARPRTAELDAAEARALRAHLSRCPACADLAEREGRVDEQLARAMRDVSVPAGLRSRLLNHLAAERSAHFRRRVVRVAAVAAALLLAIGVGWYVHFSQRPVVDADEIAQAMADRAVNSPEKVEEWFHSKQGVAMVAPTQFNDAQLNYAFLDSCGMAEFQGVLVPQLIFFHQGPGAALARIYVLSDRAFNLEDAALPTRAAGSSHRVEVFRHPDNPHVVYVVLYTGESLNPFFIIPPPGA